MGKDEPLLPAVTSKTCVKFPFFYKFIISNYVFREWTKVVHVFHSINIDLKLLAQFRTTRKIALHNVVAPVQIINAYSPHNKQCDLLQNPVARSDRRYWQKNTTKVN